MLGEEVCYQPTGVEVEMPNGMSSRQFGAWEDRRSPTYRSRNSKG